MADDTTPNTTDAADILDALPLDTALGQDGPVKLVQTVDIKDAGPCKKHIKVTVEREQIDELFDEKFTELVFSQQPQVRGFRPGKAPRKIIEKQYYKSVAEEVKTQVLMASLEQLAEEQSISPLSPPELDPNAIEVPKEGPFIYEFDIEVRPEFDLPEYKGLTIRRPIHTFTEADINKERKRVLEPHGQLAPKDGDPPIVELDDYITADVIIMHGQRELNRLSEVRFKVEEQLALSDGVASDFGAKICGAKPGDYRTVDIVLSKELGSEALRGRTVQATFIIHDVKAIRPPELTRERLEDLFGVSTPEAFAEYLQARLERHLEYTQRQEARKQVLEQIGASANWDLPQDLLRRQARKALERRVLEMKNAGMSEEEIAGRRRVLEQDVIRSTSAALKEHFVLQKVAEIEKLEIEDSDIDDEIERIADQSNESPRKVRARFEKDELMEALATDLLERKALDLTLAAATFEDYPLTPQEQGGGVATVSASAAGASGEATSADEATTATEAAPPAEGTPGAEASPAAG